jgi:hypothetical protein
MLTYKETHQLFASPSQRIATCPRVFVQQGDDAQLKRQASICARVNVPRMWSHGSPWTLGMMLYRQLWIYMETKTTVNRN